MKVYLTPAQLDRLKQHQYRSQGTSMTERFMQPFWRWVVTLLPLWVAPNLLTFVGLLVNVFTTLPILLQDPNSEGLASRWAYLSCAVGFFMYQTLDAIDGKQARRTGTNTPLGELFDHGCDAWSTFLIVASATSAIGMHSYPFCMLYFILLLLTLNFCYHWETYVCGVLNFKWFDVTEGQFIHMAILTVTFVFGIEPWITEIPILGVPPNFLLCVISIGVSLINLCIAVYTILTGGVGTNGSTVAGTSVLSPVTSLLFLIPPALYYASNSPDQLLQTQAMLFLATFCLPFVKMIIHIMVATMTKSPFPLVDYIMLGPIVACLNVYLGAPLPEIYVVTAVMLCNIIDILLMCVSLCQQVCDYLDVPCFTIPHRTDKTD